jgi:hypothetical protein
MRSQNLLATLLAIFLSTSFLSAQYFGFRAGVNIANAQVDVEQGDLEVDGVTNLQVGLFLDFPLASVISVQPELNYVGKGYEYSNSVTVGGVTFTGGEKTTIAYLDLGALLKANFGQDGPVGFYLGAGPYFSYAVSGQFDDGDNKVDIDFDADRVKRSDFSVAGAAGVTFGADLKFFADVRYMLGLANTSDRDDVTVNNRSIGITGGVMVPLGR